MFQLGMMQHPLGDDMGQLLNMDMDGPDAVLLLHDDDLKLDGNEYDMGLDFALDLEGDGL